MERVQVLHGPERARIDHDTIGSRRRRRQLLRRGDYQLRPRARCRRARFAHRFRRIDLVPLSGNSAIIFGKFRGFHLFSLLFLSC